METRSPAGGPAVAFGVCKSILHVFSNREVGAVVRVCGGNCVQSDVVGGFVGLISLEQQYFGHFAVGPVWLLTSGTDVVTIHLQNYNEMISS